jgi:hypothetical protein
VVSQVVSSQKQAHEHSGRAADGSEGLKTAGVDAECYRKKVSILVRHR